MKKPKGRAEATAYHLWKLLNKELMFAQLIMQGPPDSVKEEDFASAYRLWQKVT
jgi:hypothetical protein